MQPAFVVDLLDEVRKVDDVLEVFEGQRIDRSTSVFFMKLSAFGVVIRISLRPMERSDHEHSITVDLSAYRDRK